MPSRFAAREVIRRLLMVTFLAGVFVLSAAAVGYLSFRGHTVEVPNVIGKTESEAVIELQSYGLRIATTSKNSDKFEASAVMEQVPAAGAIVKTGQIVRVVVSQGAQNQAQK